MATHNLLDKNIPVYHRFVDNQVLTNDQLNEVIDHINYQDKQTRASLIGVGHVCGIEIRKSGNNFSTSGGVAVTSDGDLLKVKEKTFTGYKLFKDERVKYSHFIDAGSMLEMYELKEDSSPTNVKALSFFDANTGISDNEKVFILYLECYPKEEEDCSPLECNAQGEEVVRNIKVLVTSYKNAQIIASKDAIFSSFLNPSLKNAATGIAPIYVKRIILNAASAASVNSLKNAYAINWNQISNAITSVGAITLFKKQVDDFPKIIPSFFGSLSQADTNFQYLYDFYKDLVAAFNELADALNHVYTICCPDPTAFPKHILRGGLVEKTNALQHRFYASPIHDHDNSIESLQWQFGRILEMIRNFRISTKDTIVVTPSKDHHFKLGERALPFYYDLEKSVDPLLLTNTWKLNKDYLLPNYYGFDYPISFGNPLEYCLDGHDFFRVEGHVGRDVISAVKEITDIRNQKGLGFDILPIAVGSSADEETLDYDKYKIYFEDLQIILQAWNEEIKCIVSGSSQFLSKFSILNQGQHLEYAMKMVSGEGAESVPEKASLAGISDIQLKESGKAAEIGFQTYVGYSGQEKVNNVIENIATTEGSTGYYWGGQIAVEDNKNDIKVKLQEAVGDKIENWFDDYKVGSVYIPADMLGVLKDTEDNKLLDIKDFSEDNLEKFISSLQVQCDTGKKSKKTLQEYVSKAESKLKDQSYLEQYYFVLNNVISTCCMIERFRVLYEEILKRKQLLLDSMVLKEFIKKHPSAEHKAGVAEGGTLIVLYYTQAKTPSKGGKDLLTTDQIIAKNKAKEQSEEVRKFLIQWNKLTKEKDGLNRLKNEIVDDAKTGNEFLELLNFDDKKGGFASIFGEFESRRSSILADGTVIGDLCIPYICCAQTPATTFVFPDRETDLVISKNHVCIIPDKEADLVAITPTPADAEVQAFVDGNEIEGAIRVIDQKYFFNPNAVNFTDYNKEITFVVNGQNVAPTIAVYLKPQPAFSVAGPTFSNENKRANIEILNQSLEIEDQVFEWDFEVEVFENGLKEFDYNFAVQPGEDYRYTLILTATNKECFDTFEVPLIFTVPKNDVEPETGLDIDENHICKLPGAEHDLILINPTPEDAEVSAQIAGVAIENAIKKQNGQTFFDPNEVKPEMYNQEIDFLVNTVMAEAKFTVYTEPEPVFEVRGTPKLLNNNTRLEISIANMSKAIEGQIFNWDFNGDQFKDSRASFTYEFTVEPGTVFNIHLQMEAVNGLCSALAKEIRFEFQIPQVDMGGNGNEDSCTDATLKKIRAGEERLKSFAELNINSLDNHISLFTTFLSPLYDLVNTDLDNVLAGNHDAEFKDRIGVLQSQVEEAYFTLQGAIEKNWYLRLYLESVLLFLYIQACRDGKVTAVTSITDKWLPFIDSAIESDPEVFTQLLQSVAYQELLQGLLTQLGDRLSGPMKLLLTNIITALKSLLG